MSDTPPATAFTGRGRQHKTTRSVLIADIVARGLITAGGIGTIIAVSTVCIFLVLVTLPLFRQGKVERGAEQIPIPAASLQIGSDEYRLLGWSLGSDARLRVFRLDSGEVLTTHDLYPGKAEPRPAMTSHCVEQIGSGEQRRELLAVGFDDGTLACATLRWQPRFFTPGKDELPPSLTGLEPGAIGRHSWKDGEATRDGLVVRTPLGQLRAQTLMLQRTKQSSSRIAKQPVVAIGITQTVSGNPRLAALAMKPGAAPMLGRIKVTDRVSRMTGRYELKLSKPRKLDWPQSAPSEPPLALAFGGSGRFLVLVWPDGRALRFNPAVKQRGLVEALDLHPHEGQLTRARFLLGQETLITGDSNGRVASHFLVKQIRDDGAARGGFRCHYLVRRWTSQEGPQRREELWIFAEDDPRHQTLLQTARLQPGGPTAVSPEALGAVTAEAEQSCLAGQLLLAPSAEVLTAFLAQLSDDGKQLLEISELAGPTGSPVSALGPTLRTRMIAVGHENGELALLHATSGAEVFRQRASQQAIDAVLVQPKEDGLLAVSGDKIGSWGIKAAYPAITPSTLFGPVWYEGYNEPRHTWQSSSGDDAAEPKLGMMPLIFGTIKATIYSLLFGAPLALLAAIYTSQFMHRGTRARLKPLIEMMASLPSVVLGFLAGQIFAPIVQDHVGGVGGVLIGIPLGLLLCSHIWQLLPYRLTLRYQALRLPLLLLVALPLGVLSGFYWIGPLAEQLLFGGDLLAYLNGHRQIPRAGAPEAGWMVLLLPVAGVLVIMAHARVSQHWLGGAARQWTRPQAAAYDLARLLVGVLVWVAAAYGLALLATALFGDARGVNSATKPLDTYVQRNALVVGFAMGFAVIPIIFTIADDALSAVPDHLRFASLGAGATPWQTAMRIVVPTAMSGLFSALMVGLGRAVGETMIVLMAAGGTPILEANIFNGFRTLAANIATELPEAVQGSGHYRTLFLAALLLFAMTFVLNTIAEIVRLRFRRRAGAL